MEHLHNNLLCSLVCPHKLRLVLVDRQRDVHMSDHDNRVTQSSLGVTLLYERSYPRLFMF
jgi:hypothetical protein